MPSHPSTPDAANQRLARTLCCAVDGAGKPRHQIAREIFDTFYKRNDFSTAAAQSVILFVIILILTLMQNRFFGKRAFGG